jgi:hypothetical protein
MAVNWTQRVRLQNGSEADYLGRCPITGKHRVHQASPSNPTGPTTTWLLDDDGRCRGDKQPCGEDYAAAA